MIPVGRNGVVNLHRRLPGFSLFLSINLLFFFRTLKVIVVSALWLYQKKSVRSAPLLKNNCS